MTVMYQRLVMAAPPIPLLRRGGAQNVELQGARSQENISVLSAVSRLSPSGESSRPTTTSLSLALHIRVCNTSRMATNLAIDDNLLDEALKIGGQRTKKATVTQALEEYIQHRRQTEVLKLFGKVEMQHDYDYKLQRRRR
jgi:Arc/MetJ family transcription regulator